MHVSLSRKGGPRYSVEAFAFLQLLGEVGHEGTSCHKSGICCPREQHPSFLGTKVIVQCDTRSIVQNVMYHGVLKKKKKSALLIDLPIFLGFKMQIFSSY